MADAKFSIGTFNIVNNIRVIAYEASNPTAEVYNAIYLATHPPVRNIVITNLSPQTHIFEFYETTATSGNSPVGSLRSRFTIDVGLIADYTVKFIEFTVGEIGAPANGDTQYNNSLLANLGVDVVQVSQRSVGIRSWGSEIAIKTTGGFDLLNGEIFNQDDKWFIMYLQKQVVAQPSVTQNRFASVKYFNGSFSLDSTYNNSLILYNGPSPRLWFSAYFQNINSIPDYTEFTFNLMGSGCRGLNVYGNGLNFLGFPNEPIFYLRTNEWITFIKIGNDLIIVDGKGNWDKVGWQVNNTGLQNTTTDNQLIKEWGQTLNINEEERFFRWYVNKLPSSYLSTTNDAVDRAKFRVYTTQFRMPDTRYMVNINPANSFAPGKTLSKYFPSSPSIDSIDINYIHFSRIL